MPTTNQPTIDPVIDSLLKKLRFRVKMINDDFDGVDIGVVVAVTIKRKENPVAVNTVQTIGTTERVVDCAAALITNKTIQLLMSRAIRDIGTGDKELFNI